MTQNLLETDFNFSLELLTFQLSNGGLEETYGLHYTLTYLSHWPVFHVLTIINVVNLRVFALTLFRWHSIFGFELALQCQIRIFNAICLAPFSPVLIMASWSLKVYWQVCTFCSTYGWQSRKMSLTYFYALLSVKMAWQMFTIDLSAAPFLFRARI